MTTTLQYAVSEGIATLTFHRPEARNAFDVPTVQELYRRSVEAAEDPAVRVIALTGAGGHFSAGADVKLVGMALARDRREVPLLFKELTVYFHAAVATLARAPKPFLTAVDGTAAGGGFSLAIAGDVSVASDRAEFTYAYTGIALAPDGSSTYSLPRMIGVKKALWLAYRNQKIKSAEALALGLVNEVYPAASFEEKWRALARELAAGPTQAYAAAKRLVRESFGRDHEAQMEDERDAITACSRTSDFLEGCMAFVEKRKPVFRGT